MLSAEFEQIDRSCQVVFNDLTTGRGARYSRKDAGIGCGIDNPIGCRTIFNVACASDVAIPDGYTNPGKFHAVHFAPRSGEIIDSKNFDFRIRVAEVPSEAASDKSADSS